MKLPFPKCIALACILAAGLPIPVHAQLNALKKAVGSEDSTQKTPTPETPEQVRARIAQWHDEARDTLAKLDVQTTPTVLPDGVTPLEFDDRRRGLEAMVMVSTQWLKSIDDAQNALKTPTSTQTDEWTGFKESPPYSILMVDDLLNDRDAVSARLVISESTLSNFQRVLAGIIEDTKSAEEQVSACMISLQKSDPAKADAAKWRLEAAREKSRQLAARSALYQSNCQDTQQRISDIKDDLALIDKKIKIASADSRFTDEDLTKLRKISAERKKAAQKEADSIAKRLKSAKIPLAQAQASLEKLTATATPDQEPDGLEVAKLRASITQDRVDALQEISEWLEGLPQLENITIEAYEQRRQIINATTPEQRVSALDLLRKSLDRLQAWDNVLDNEVASAESDLGQLEFRAASIAQDDPRFSLLDEQRAIKTERLATIKRLSESLTTLSKLVKRWVKQYSPKPEHVGMFPRIKLLAATSWVTIQKIWSFELMSFEDRIVVDGQTITGHIPITLGTLLRALLFFAIGYWIASHISKRVQRGLVSRGHIADAQARTLRNWAMIVVGIFLAIGTLDFLKIPLTVFAFFGGALAIGLGFGLQTLIKNFISGIIVLAERKVRVGDILDVDGIVGTVVEVNTRSSVIRSADDVETMIPNSLFLENRVTNWTLSSSKMRRNLTVGVAYGSSPQAVMEILTDAASRHGLVCKEPAPLAVFQDFGDSALVFTLYFWVNMRGTGNAMVITSDLRIMIEKRFGEVGINVPFPQRDINFNPDKPIQVQMAPAPNADPTA